MCVCPLKSSRMVSISLPDHAHTHTKWMHYKLNHFSVRLEFPDLLFFARTTSLFARLIFSLYLISLVLLCYVRWVNVFYFVLSIALGILLYSIFFAAHSVRRCRADRLQLNAVSQLFWQSFPLSLSLCVFCALCSIHFQHSPMRILFHILNTNTFRRKL